jgi:hypothetical protein
MNKVENFGIVLGIGPLTMPFILADDPIIVCNPGKPVNAVLCCPACVFQRIRYVVD